MQCTTLDLFFSVKDFIDGTTDKSQYGPQLGKNIVSMFIF